MVVDPLSRLIINNDTLKPQKYHIIHESLPHEQLFFVDSTPCYVDNVNYLSCDIIKQDLSFQERKICLYNYRSYFWDDPFLFRIEKDDIIRECFVMIITMKGILEAARLRLKFSNQEDAHELYQVITPTNR